MNKASAWVVLALDKAGSALPMGLKGIHSDTGSEFINKPVDGTGGTKTENGQSH
jgi:hypothetical protein